MFKRQSLFNNKAETQEINISPLIDVVFILLIFFIVTAVFVDDKGIEVDRPQAINATVLDKQSLVISITAAGDVIYRNRKIGSKGVKSIVKQQQGKPVVIKADEKVSTKLLIEVLDQAKLAGAKNVNVATES